MKKYSIIFLLFLFITSGCGDVSSEQAQNLNNEYHSIKDMNKAKNLLVSYFKINFDGCTLETISYDKNSDAQNELCDFEGGYEEVIVLNMKFRTNDKQVSLNNNSVYNYTARIGKKNGRWSIIPGQVGQG